MTTVAEIESAVERLPPEGVEELATWLIDYRASLVATGLVFQQYDAEEADSECQWVGEQ